MDKYDLAVLRYTDNPKEIKLVNAVSINDLEINLQKQTWSDGVNIDVPFGIDCKCTAGSKNVIGVYNPKDFQHLKVMIQSCSARVGELI